MVAECKLRNEIKELRDNCTEFINRLNECEISMAMGQAATQVSQVHSAGTGSKQINITVSPKNEELLILTHAFIIQEWQIFLDNIYEKVLTYTIRSAGKSKLDKCCIRADFDVLSVDFSSTAKVRDSIVGIARSSFAFDTYDSKIKWLRKAFETECCSSQLEFIRKNVNIRNIFQHHKGIVKPDMIRKMGGKLTITDDDGNEKEYLSEEKLSISKKEIMQLIDSIKGVTAELEVYK